jgi:hypothetical protein
MLSSAAANGGDNAVAANKASKASKAVGRRRMVIPSILQVKGQP